MSSTCNPKHTCYRRDIHRLLLAAEAGQRDDILTYSSGHLGPRSLNHSQPHRETKQSFWKISQSLEETANPLTHVKKKEIKEPPSELPAGTALVQSEVSRSRHDQATGCSSHADNREDKSLPKIVYCPSNRASNSSSDLERKQRSDQKGLVKTNQQDIAKQDFWAGINVAEMHERKLQKELKRLSVQSWPSRDRLAVFSDVFDDVCEGSLVFGRILREIKTDYDLYVNHLMASQPLQDNMWLDTSLKDIGQSKVKQKELEDAEKEVCRLELEARRALEENKRVQSEWQTVLADRGPEDSDMQRLRDKGTAISRTNSVQSKRLKVLNTWREIQQLEEEIKEKLVSSDGTAATERCIKDLKTEIMRLIASSHCLKTTNKVLEDNINMVLNREKASKAIRRMLWDEIRCDLPTESE